MWLIFAILSVLPELPFHGKLTPELRSQLAVLGHGEKVYVVVHMIQEYPYDDVKHLQIHQKIQTFREIARTSQQPCIEYLNLFPDKGEVVRQLWVFNGFHMRATKDMIEEIALRNDVWYISHNAHFRIPPLTQGRNLFSRGIEWNVRKVMADSCWTAGFTGEGIVIGHIDTGVYPDHEALIGKWTG
jgi:subtilisin family serine protease